MGGGKKYNSSGGFDIYEWKTEETIDGIKVVTKKGTSNNALPQYSSTSSAYIRKDGEDYVQIREYHNRLVQKDIDLFVENNHTNKNSEELVLR